MSLKTVLKDNDFLFAPWPNVPISADDLESLARDAEGLKRLAKRIQFSGGSFEFTEILSENKIIHQANPEAEQIISVLMQGSFIDLYHKFGQSANGNIYEAQVNYFNQGDGFSVHSDELQGYPLAINCILGLSNSYQGGQFSFENGPSFHIVKGDLLLSNPAKQHLVRKVTSGSRITIAYSFI